MQYLSELPGCEPLVHEWKPITDAQWAEAVFRLTIRCCDQFGNNGIPHTKAFNLDRVTRGSLIYMPKNGTPSSGIYSPVLLAIERADGKVIYFQSLKYEMPMARAASIAQSMKEGGAG